MIRILKTFEADDASGTKVRVGLIENDDSVKLTLCHVKDSDAECWSTKEDASKLYELARAVYAGLGFNLSEVESMDVGF